MCRLPKGNKPALTEKHKTALTVAAVVILAVVIDQAVDALGNDGPKAKKGKRYNRSKAERRKALLRDADDPNSGLTQAQRDFIKKNNGKRVPDGFEVSHEVPLYTKPVDERSQLDKEDNMKTQPKPEHRERHKKGGDQYEEYGPP